MAGSAGASFRTPTRLRRNDSIFLSVRPRMSAARRAFWRRRWRGVFSWGVCPAAALARPVRRRLGLAAMPALPLVRQFSWAEPQPVRRVRRRGEQCGARCPGTGPRPIRRVRRQKYRLRRRMRRPSSRGVRGERGNRGLALPRNDADRPIVCLQPADSLTSDASDPATTRGCRFCLVVRAGPTGAQWTALCPVQRPTATWRPELASRAAVRFARPARCEPRARRAFRCRESHSPERPTTSFCRDEAADGDLMDAAFFGLVCLYPFGNGDRHPFVVHPSILLDSPLKKAQQAPSDNRNPRERRITELAKPKFSTGR